MRKLGGILRLTDGLDRRRNQQVNNIGGKIHRDIFKLILFGGNDLSVELYGAQRKGDLFASTFSCRLAVTTEEQI